MQQQKLNILHVNVFIHSGSQVYLVVENKHMIIVTAETKINLVTWWSFNVVDISIQDMLADYTSFLIKTFSGVINKHYDRSMKGIHSEPTRRFPHTRVSSSIHLSPAIGGLKPWVLDCTQQDLPDRRKIKDSKDMQGLFGLLVYCICWKHY